MPDNKTFTTPDSEPAATGRKVLLIEDETFITDLYSRSLKKAGYSASVVIDGPKALEEAKTNKYDIILLDIMLPNLMGTDILKQLKSTVPPIKAKIIITTNLEMQKEDRAKIESQADGYLIKADITPNELVSYLSQIGS